MVLLVVVGTGLACSEEQASQSSAEEPEHGHGELAQHMAHLQRWTHKTALALDARNPELTEFYLHEMEESIETIQTEVSTYEGYEIGALTETMLVPSVDGLDEAVEARDWAAVDARVDEVETSCNQCHAATDHGFVQIDLQEVPNPYAQDFSSSGDGQDDS